MAFKTRRYLGFRRARAESFILSNSSIFDVFFDDAEIQKVLF